MLTDDLLLPTLDVYVLEEWKSDQIIAFKPTHPDVQLSLSRKTRNGHWIEVSLNQNLSFISRSLDDSFRRYIHLNTEP